MLKRLMTWIAARQADKMKTAQAHEDKTLRAALHGTFLAGHAYQLCRLRKVTEEAPYRRGKFVNERGRIYDMGGNDKVSFTSGYAIGGQGNSLWVGETLRDVHMAGQHNGFHVSNADLLRLKTGEVAEITFPHPKDPSAVPVYRLNDGLVTLAKAAGYKRVGSYQIEQRGEDASPQEGDLIVKDRNGFLSVYAPELFDYTFGWKNDIRQAVA